MVHREIAELACEIANRQAGRGAMAASMQYDFAM
jgi:hypothetical protein